jgi:Aromatic acid exporter family member 1
MAARPAKGAGADLLALGALLRTPYRQLGSQLTVVKAAVAGSLSYAIAANIGPARYAVLAPVVAMFTVQGSVLGTLGQGVQRVTGTVVGVGLAAVWVQLVGTTWWSLLVALVVSLEGARRLPLGVAGQVQIPVSVVLTVGLGPTATGYGQWRVADTLVGGLVGILVGVLVPERPAFRGAREAQHAWGDALLTQLDAIAAEIEQAPRDLGDKERHAFVATSAALYDTAVIGRSASAIAEEGVFFNPRGRGHRDQLDLLSRREQELVRLTLEVRVLSLTIDQLYDRSRLYPRLDRAELARILRGLAELYRRRREGEDVAAASDRLRARIAAAVAAVTADESDAYAVLDSVSLLGRLEQLRGDITGRDPAAVLQPRTGDG